MDEQTETNGSGTTRAGATRAGLRSAGRRVPVWLYIVVGVVLVALAGTVALVLSNGGGGLVPEAEVVTLPVPSPTVEAIPRESGTAFYEALPSTVLAYAMSASVAAPELSTLGALEGYQIGYTDGSTTVTLLAGQWETTEAATAAYAAVSTAGDASPSPAPSASPSAASDAPVSGDVTVSGSVVGAWSLTAGADGSGILTWSNGTVVLQLSGPAAALRDVYAAFPL